tara:strand:+ start:276 stop:419 length:144 start_codon:yes stop_codon:yes gene_type:complete
MMAMQIDPTPAPSSSGSINGSAMTALLLAGVLGVLLFLVVNKQTDDD